MENFSGLTTHHVFTSFSILTVKAPKQEFNFMGVLKVPQIKGIGGGTKILIFGGGMYQSFASLSIMMVKAP